MVIYSDDLVLSITSTWSMKYEAIYLSRILWLRFMFTFCKKMFVALFWCLPIYIQQKHKNTGVFKQTRDPFKVYTEYVSKKVTKIHEWIQLRCDVFRWIFIFALFIVLPSNNWRRIVNRWIVCNNKLPCCDQHSS